MKTMFHSSLLVVFALAGVTSAQWEPLGAPRTFSVQFAEVHKGKAYAGIGRQLFAGDDEGFGRTVFYPIDALSSGLTTATSWGEEFVTGSQRGRVVVYSDVSSAQRRIEGHPTTQAITSLAGIGSVLLVGSFEGVHRSTDTLQSAILTSAALGFRGVNQLVPVAGSVFAATDSGLFASDDTGSTWRKIATPRRRINDVALQGDTLLVATETGLHVSSDRGATWLPPLWPTERVSRVLVRQDGLYATTQTDLLHKPTGGAWRPVSIGLAGQFLNVLDLGETSMVASFWGIAVSQEKGPWIPAQSASGAMLANIQALSSQGDLLLAGTDNRGAFASWDGGRTWSMRSHAFHHGAVYGILANAIHDGVWFSSTSLGTYRSADSGISWTKSDSGLPSDAGLRSFRSEGGRSWAGTDSGLFHTDDLGTTWNALSVQPAGRGVNDLAILPGGRLLAATDSGLEEALPPYASWTRVDLPKRAMRRLVRKGDTLYVSGTSGGPWRSRDGAATWTEVGAGLESSFLLSLASGSRQAVAADGMGRLYTIGHTDASWTSFQGDLPQSDVGALVVVDDTVIAWSKFFGMYRRALPAPTVSVQDHSRQNPSVGAFVHDPRERSLRILDPASVAGVVVRDAGGRTVLQATAHTGWLSLARLPIGIYGVTVVHRDRRVPTTAMLLHR